MLGLEIEIEIVFFILRLGLEFRKGLVGLIKVIKHLNPEKTTRNIAMT